MHRALTARPSFVTPVVALLLAVAISAPLAAAQAIEQTGAALPQANWTRFDAERAARTGSDPERISRWLDSARSGDLEPLIRELDRLRADPPAPAVEADVFRFTARLADLPMAVEADPVIDPLLDRLGTWPARVRVPHHDHPEVAVPLYNIAAAAHGVRRDRQRQAGRLRSAVALAGTPGDWMAAFEASGPTVREGFLDALRAAPADRRRTIARHALQAVSMTSGDAPSTAPVVAAVAAPSLARADASLFALRAAPGDRLVRLLTDSAATLDEHGRAELLLGAIAEAPAERAALAVAILGPGLAGRAEVTDSLFDLLADSSLGPGSALVLARHPDPAVRARLRDLAANSGPGGHRAAVALAAVAPDPAPDP